jgi:hypothetical protein
MELLRGWPQQALISKHDNHHLSDVPPDIATHLRLRLAFPREYAADDFGV